MVHASRGRLDPASTHLLSEPAIVCRLARRVLGEESRTPWEEFEKDYATVRDRIARVIPGFENFNARVADPAASPSRTPRATSAASRPPPARPTSPPHPSSSRSSPKAACCCRPCARTTSTTPRSTAWTTATGASRTAAGSSWSTPRTREPSELADGSYVDLVSEWKDGVERRAPGFRIVFYPTARGCAAAYYPETNVLVPLDATADTSNTPASKSVVVRLEQSATD